MEKFDPSNALYIQYQQSNYICYSEMLGGKFKLAQHKYLYQFICHVTFLLYIRHTLKNLISYASQSHLYASSYGGPFTVWYITALHQHMISC